MKTKRYIAICLAVLATLSCGKDAPVSPDPVPVDVINVPEGLEVSAVTESSLTFKWNPVSGASSYGYRLLKGMTQFKDGTVNSTSVTIDGLDDDTEYRMDVKAIAGDRSSSYCSKVLATTLKKQVTPDPVTSVYEEMMIPACEEDGIARAFPGAEGGGMYATGGRGGKVLHVTSLADDGSEGTLRWAVNQKYARTIVFDVAGIIELKSALKVNYGDLTIAGQTAPGDGICLKNYCTQISAGNVIIRFVRFRLGDEGPNAGDSDDAIWCRYQDDIILDHCSMSWSIDECASFYANANMTMQWCILAESMKACDKHSKGSHGYGGIWGGSSASFHHNILAHHDSRNPRFDHPHIYENHKEPARRGVVDFRNNVVYDWGANNAYGGEGYGAGKGEGINMVSNYYKPGPSSSDKKYFLDAYGVYTSTCSDCGGVKNIEEGYPLVYMSGNVHTKYSDISAANADGIYWHNGESHANYGKTASSAFGVKSTGGKTIYTTTHSAEKAMEMTCEWAGARLSRDKVDMRIADHVRNGRGQTIDKMSHVETLYGFKWPAYKATEEQISIASIDSDGDGIPDYYETLLGLDKTNASDAQEFTIDTHKRYTNLEMYLHYLVRTIISGETEGGTYAILQ